MNNEIVFREFKASDSKIFEDAIKKTWQFERFAGTKAAEIAAEIYLLGCLSEQNFTCVAEKEGIPLGVIMMNEHKVKKSNIKYKAKIVMAMVRLLLSGGALKFVKFQGMIDIVYNELLKNTKKDYDCTLQFFIVTENSRGLGVGKLLYDKAVSYVKEQSIQNFYLYTDTMCNYGFYERQGMQRKGEKTMKTPYIGDENTYFLYDMNLESKES